MSGDEPAGVAFPVAADGRRSTSALGQAVVADALGRVDPAGALDAGRETNWRTGYLAHFRRLIEAGLTSKQAAVSVARDGLASLHRRMRFVEPGWCGDRTGCAGLGACAVRADRGHGGGHRRWRKASCRCPTGVSGCAAAPCCAGWRRGSPRASSSRHARTPFRPSPRTPDWLALPGRTVVALGAGAEVGPLPVLLSWGARVIGVDLPRPVIWERVLETARCSGGTLLVPVAQDEPGERLPGAGDEDLAQRAGVDLAGDVPAVADWLAGIEGPLVLGNYVYADGAANVRVASAVDALTVRLQAERRDVALAFLATPTDVFAVPADAVAQSARAYAARSRAAKLGSWPLRTLSGGRLLRPAYPPGPTRHLRRPDTPAGAQLRPGQARAALARHGGP